MSENVGASTSCNPKGLHSLYGHNFTLPSIYSFYLIFTLLSHNTTGMAQQGILAASILLKVRSLYSCITPPNFLNALKLERQFSHIIDPGWSFIILTSTVKMGVEMGEM
jgi:hypothetical protein